MNDFIKLEGIWCESVNCYVKNNSEWTETSLSQLNEIFNHSAGIMFGGVMSGQVVHTLSIVGSSAYTSEYCSFTAMYDGTINVSSAATWSVLSGGEYITVNSNGGEFVITAQADNSNATIQAVYDGYTATKDIVVTYKSGSQSQTETETVTDESGNTTTTTTTTTTNEDGSSTSNTVEIVTDSSGNTMGSTENTTTTNEDGSFSSSTITYDESGTPTTAQNQSGDSGGTVSTQDLEYDESGNTVVTGYDIDTTNTSGGSKTFNGDGVNTEFYAFDLTRGFVLDFNFTIDFTQQPAGQDENHHNILTAKRATPSPWYGFQLRQTSTNKFVTLGTQFSTGSNTNTNVNPMSSTGNTNEYNFRILYNPTVNSNSFICRNMNNGNNIYTSNNKFPDINDLKYLKVTIGYAMDANGDPFRYSNINVKNFTIKRLENLYTPVIVCDDNEIIISCDTSEAVIYYRLNQSGNYTQYVSPIAISENTIVESYAMYYEWSSATVIENCEYDEGVTISNPLIYCDGTSVSITCATEGAAIYYRLNQDGEYSAYTESFAITADTVVEAYAQIGEDVSEVVEKTCIYSEVHDYSTDYITLRIKSAGTVCWSSVGSQAVRPIQYSINGGNWLYLTPSQTGTSVSINVSDSDVVRLKGSYASYATSNANYMGFSGGTAMFDVEGNIMSLVYGDSFIGNSSLTGTYNFCSMFKQTNVVSAENLVLPAMTLTPYCYRALFANSPSLIIAPELPATTLADGCYRYIFQDASIATAPDLLAQVLVYDCYEGMFDDCHNLNYIKCLAKDISASAATLGWTQAVSSSGTFVKDANTEWSLGANGIPTRWVIVEEGLKKPSISCDGLYITLLCSTQGASIYYRFNESGEYTLYTTPISISADTTVEAYSMLDEETSSVVKEVCVYDDGIDEPVIYCDGEYVTISCTTGGASIYYKFDQEINYTPYDSAILITGDTTCYAYSEIDGRQSEIVSANCIYDESLKVPVITCNGTGVTIECRTVGAAIYYRENEEGVYVLYTTPFAISADTIVEAYSEKDGETSMIVSQLCEYNDVHDYSLDYLTFDILTDGVIRWATYGTGQTKTIQYSINDGTWTNITAGNSSTISVLSGDKVRFKGNNTSYSNDKSRYSGFDSGCTASFNIEGNIMSLVYGDNFVGNTALTGTYNFCSMFKQSKCISAENLVLPSTTLTNYCYRAMFSKCSNLTTPPELPATTLATACYYYMFEECAFSKAPDLLAETLVTQCYYAMFTGCTSLNYIKCMATSINASQCKNNWVAGVSQSGTFVKSSSISESTWGRGSSNIPTNWLVYDNVAVASPVISCDGYNNVTITCETSSATIYYKTAQLSGDNYTVYTTPFVISEDTVVEAYAEFNGQESMVVRKTCEYISDIPLEASNRNLSRWNYNNQEITTPYSVNKDDGHSASYAKGTFNFETSFALREAQPTYLWFQHADQSATIYVDDNLVEKHWGGYAAFSVDISNYVHSGTNKVKVALKNNEGNSLAPASADFNFNATLGNVKLFTSPYVPGMIYGYDGFHVISDVTTSSATVNVRTCVPTGATVTCEIDDGTYHFGTSGNSTGLEMEFTAIIPNPHLWDGKNDPHLYNITLNIYHEGELYHSYQRPYGLRFYEYVINETVSGNTYTGFLLNGHPYLLRGCCMHDDIAGKANALTDSDYSLTFATIQELGCNFLRLAHYPHPKETYDWCDRLGIIVQTEGPCVNKMQSTMPSDYYEHLNGQYDDMVNQHYNHPCICFWGLSNETTTDDKDFAKEKINGYIARIKALDSERMVGYVMAQGPGSDPSAYYNNPDADWFGCNIYEGWYNNTNSNNPSTQLNTRVRNVITNKSKALAYSEYGCGGTQRCHSDDFMTTTTRGNYERHDIEYMMWLHEGHIAAIKNYPQLLFTSQWQLFDIAVSNRNEGYTVCLDGENTSIDDNLRRLNDKGLVERDHVTKKDTFYLYKAEWSDENFVHICGKDYTKTIDRVIKCYTNDGDTLDLFVNGTFVERTDVTNHIATFTTNDYNVGDIIMVDGATSSDTFTF